jgi:hypothetical protein
LVHDRLMRAIGIFFEMPDSTFSNTTALRD